jgi:ankyrin repeat protein
MLVKQPAIIRSFYQTLVLFIGLVGMLSATSCKCSIPKPPNHHSGRLTMEISPMSLVGPEKTIEATFTASDSKKPVDLKQYQVRISFIETGGTGSSLRYTDGTKSPKVITSKLQETVGHFFSTATLKPNESFPKVAFTLVPGTLVTAVAIQFELLDKTDQVLQPYTVNWEKGTPRLSMALTYEPVTRVVIYNIQNRDQDVAEKVQLRYTNISEDAADKTVLLDDKETKTLNLGDMAGGRSTGEKSLVLNFKAATQATFKFEVLCQGIVVATATKEQKFSIKVPRLKITPVGPTFLVGNNHTITFKVEPEDPQEEIELDKLRLSINPLIIGDPRTAIGNSAKIFYKGLEAINDINGGDIEGLNQNIPLTIRPGGVSKAAFSIQLLYGGIPLGSRQTFIWTTDSTATPTLCEAAELDDIELLKQLLNTGGVDVNATNENGVTALHIYAQKNNPEAIQLLVDKGADINMVRHDPYDPVYHTTPLNIAARCGDQAVVNQFLKTPGINVNFKDSKGKTPLHSLLGTPGNKTTVETIRQLIAKGADVNATNNTGDTPLHYVASQLHRPAFVEELLKAPGIDINAKNDKDNTPLHLAVKAECVSIVKLLLDKGARQDLPNNEGKTALDLAATSTNEEIKNLFNI